MLKTYTVRSGRSATRVTAGRSVAAITLPVALIMATSSGGMAQAPPDSTTVLDSTAAAPPPSPRPARTLSAWTSDRRTYEAGDVLTVFVDERTLAMASADEYARDDRRFGRGANVNPGFRFNARLDGDASSDERGVSQRDERFRTEISVRVVEVTGAAMRVEGTKKFQVDSHEQEVTLRGWVRTQDVDSQNIVEGWRLADLELLYASNGELMKPTIGILQKLLGIVF